MQKDLFVKTNIICMIGDCMKVEFFNLPYFIFILIAVGSLLGLYHLLKNKSQKTKYWVIFALLFFNLVLHFLKLTFPPYSTDPDKAMRDVWFINICAVSVLTFPIFYVAKSKVLKDFIFYLGVISGTLAMLIPTEALGEAVWQLDLFRFYIAHMIILIAPFLMVLLKVHTLDYKRIWKIPFIMMGVLAFIVFQQVLQSELGIVSLRSSDFFNPNYKNPSLIWGPGNEELAVLFKIFTPDFLKTVPYGAYAGQVKYWPFFWLLPAIIIYFTIIPFLICLPWEMKHIKNDCKKLQHNIKAMLNKNKEKQ